MKRAKKLYLHVLTHCESCYNKGGIFTGRIDSVLSENGHAHAKMLAEKLKDKKIDLAYTSRLKRSKQTLKYIMKYHPDAKVVIDDRIIERDYGRLARKSKNKFKRDYPELFPLYHRSYETAPPGGESIREVEKRVMPFIRELVKTMREKRVNVLIVAHSNSIRPIRKYFEKLSVEEMMKLENYRHETFTYAV